MAAKKKTASKKKDVQSKERTPLANQILTVVLFVVGIFLLISFLFDITGVAGRFISNFFKGFLGTAAYFLPFFLFFLAIRNSKSAIKFEFSIKLWSGIVFLVNFSALMLIISNFKPETQGINNVIGEMFSHGTANIISGGLIGSALGLGMRSLLDVVGSLIVIILLLLISFMLLTGITARQIYKFFIPFKMKDVAKAVGEKIVSEEEEEKAPKSKKKEPVIDIPVDEPRKIDDEQVDNIMKTLSEGSESIENEQELSETEAVIPPKEEEKEPVETEEFDIEEEKKEAPKKSSEGYTFPPITLLKQDVGASPAADVSDELKQNGKKLIDTLKSFGVDASIVNISRGPSVTRYEIAPGVGVKISKIANLADDIALNLAAMGVRIEAPIPGKAAIGIEIPNNNISSVFIRDILASREFREAKSNLSVCLGKDITGNHIITDLSKMPHLLVAGATGSGKSVCINSIIISLLYKSSPEQVKLLMIDPKVVELKIYNSIPHLLIPVVTDPKKAAGALNWAVVEMLDRYKKFAEQNVRDITGYNENAKVDENLETMPHIVVIIDELADLMMAAPNEVEDSICRLAQMARAAGMHLVIATQRPSTDVITGTIKANVPSRISFKVSSQVDSRIILDVAGAEKLLGRGDMLFCPVGQSKPTRIQGCFVSDKEVEAVTDFVSGSADVTYDDSIIEHIETKAAEAEQKNKKVLDDNASDEDEMLPAAIEVVVEAGMASVSLLQRKLKLGYARAARIVDQLEQKGIVGPYEGAKPRQVLISKVQYQEMLMNTEKSEE
ncbi:MAG: DNA translocase FtsK [Ruminococcaceae bacterium]|nr:DNA translocase FtsK [Oscillospiraceae bacterium]